MICVDSKPFGPNPIPGPKGIHNLYFWPDSLPSPRPAEPTDSKAFPLGCSTGTPKITCPDGNPSCPPEPRAPGLPIRGDVTFGHSVSEKEPRLLSRHLPAHAQRPRPCPRCLFPSVSPPRLRPDPPGFVPVSSDLDFPAAQLVLLCKTNPTIRSSSGAQFCCPASPGLSWPLLTQLSQPTPGAFLLPVPKQDLLLCQPFLHQRPPTHASQSQQEPSFRKAFLAPQG